MQRLRNLALMLVAVMTLAACQTEIYSNLSEREANEMLSALLAANINAKKVVSSDEGFNISVDNSDIQNALAVLDAEGLPRNNRESIGQVFAKSGIVSSPFEERVRYVYALGEEVAQTIQQIDGVLIARVHIVMPEEPELGQAVKPSSAAVFIKQQAGFDLDFLVPQIRRLVANSIEGVAYEEVTVVMVDAQPTTNNNDRPEQIEMTEVLPGITLATAMTQTFWMWAGGLAAACALLLLLTIFLIFKMMGLSRKLKQSAQDEEYA